MAKVFPKIAGAPPLAEQAAVLLGFSVWGLYICCFLVLRVLTISGFYRVQGLTSHALESNFEYSQISCKPLRQLKDPGNVCAAAPAQKRAPGFDVCARACAVLLLSRQNGLCALFRSFVPNSMGSRWWQPLATAAVAAALTSLMSDEYPIISVTVTIVFTHVLPCYRLVMTVYCSSPS